MRSYRTIELSPDEIAQAIALHLFGEDPTIKNATLALYDDQNELAGYAGGTLRCEVCDPPKKNDGRSRC